MTRPAHLCILALHRQAGMFLARASGVGSPLLRRLWLIEAGNHRFGGNAAELNRKLLDALEWIRAQRR